MQNVLNYLLPQPRRVEYRDKPISLKNRICIIHLDHPDERVGRAAGVLGESLKRAGVEYRISPTPPVSSGEECVISLGVESDSLLGREGYEIGTSSDGIRITGAAPAGLFYGIMTFLQIIDLHREQIKNLQVLPDVHVLDYPDFNDRGILLDVSRDKIPTMETLFDLVDLFARLKYNQLQLYFEHVFAYQGHEIVWQNASPFTPGEIRKLDAFCRERFVQLVPNQNSFGHFNRWLVHDRYRDLAECPEGFNHMFSLEREPFSLNPLDPRCITLLEDLYDQLLPNFSSTLFNVGLDESFDLGHGRSADACSEGRKPQVYLDFLLKVSNLVKSRNHTMMYWGDVVFQHPELIEKLPGDALALIWGYEADHPFDEQTSRMNELGLPYYVCPGTSSWNSLTGRTDNVLGNLKNASFHGKRNGAAGLLVTDWGDNGHLQPLPVSFPGFAAGAAAAWNTGAAQQLDSTLLAELLDRHVFSDAGFDGGGVGLGSPLLELGNIYTVTDCQEPNFSTLFLLLGISSHESGTEIITRVTSEELEKVRLSLNALISGIEEGDTVGNELRWAADLLLFACDFGELRITGESENRRILLTRLDKLIRRHRELWLKRNRPGGLEDSVRRLEHIKKIITSG